jgi:hypothetical protein
MFRRFTIRFGRLELFQTGPRAKKVIRTVDRPARAFGNVKYFLYLLPVVPAGIAFFASSKVTNALQGNFKETDLDPTNAKNQTNAQRQAAQLVQSAATQSAHTTGGFPSYASELPANPHELRSTPELLGDLKSRPDPIADEKSLMKLCNGDQGWSKESAKDISKFVRIERLVPPTFARERPREGHGVKLEYDVMLRDGTLVDTTRGTKTAPFFLGRGNLSDLVCGLELALPHLAVGEQARLHVPAFWAYKHHGWEAKGIPPNADLIFHVHVIEVR